MNLIKKYKKELFVPVLVCSIFLSFTQISRAGEFTRDDFVYSENNVIKGFSDSGYKKVRQKLKNGTNVNEDEYLKKILSEEQNKLNSGSKNTVVAKKLNKREKDYVQGVTKPIVIKKDRSTQSSTSTNSDNIKDNFTSNNITVVKEKEIEIRYPNKLKSVNGAVSMTEEEKAKINKGVKKPESNARGTVTEDVSNANKEYPIYHGKQAKESKNKSNEAQDEMYAADARQFITFTTKGGKTFHLIINHDEEEENVMLLTEVCEDDLLNMTDAKEAKEEKPKKVVKEETNEDEEEEKETLKKEKEDKKSKEESKTDFSLYLIMGLVVAVVMAIAYMRKKNAKKEEEMISEGEDSDLNEEDFIKFAEDEKEEVQNKNAKTKDEEEYIEEDDE